jgi:excinuclease ABC subunit B
MELDWDEVVRIRRIHPLTGDTIEELDSVQIYPAKHFVMPEEQVHTALERIRRELKDQLEYFEHRGKLLEAQRLRGRTEYDLEMLQEMGYCSGIENYSAPLSGRGEGQRPAVLLDYFPEKFLTFIDESHVTLPQVGAMYEGDRSRKMNLVEHGFRLPSALDNRPLFYAEFEELIDRVIYVSATPGKLEKRRSERLVEQIIRPTGRMQ